VPSRQRFGIEIVSIIFSQLIESRRCIFVDVGHSIWEDTMFDLSSINYVEVRKRMIETAFRNSSG
jgi:hypothetical protein